MSTRRRLAAGASALALAGCAVLALAGCAGQAGQPAGAGTTPSSILGGHVHGLAATADGTRLLVATHEGVYDAGGGQARLVSAPDDVMGLAGDPAGTLWASGHPGPGSTRPNPLGLIRSTDGGRTWTAVSNEGESDFHALAVTRSGLVGFDGALKRSATGESWDRVPAPLRPAHLAGHASTDTVLATTEKGLFTSPDGGTAWHAVPQAPLLQFVALADAARAVGVAPDGAVYSSADAGLTWARTGDVGGEVHALAAAAPDGGPVRVFAATDAGLRASDDGGASFTDYGARQP